MSKNRIEAFTDGILAIIMTIMVLELPIPTAPTWAALQAAAIPAFAFIVSFLGLTNLWVRHHDIFREIEAVSYGMFWVNMLLLLWVAFMPIATAWVAEFPRATLPQLMFSVVEIGWLVLLAVLGWFAAPAINGKRPPFPLWPTVSSTLLVVIGAILAVWLPYVALVAGVLTALRVIATHARAHA